LHLQNLEASYELPLQIFVDRKLVQTMTKSMELNKESILKVELSGEATVVNIRINSRVGDIDVKNDFDLSKGNHVQFANVDDQLRIAQRNDRKFPEIKYQFKKKEEEVEEKKKSL